MRRIILFGLLLLGLGSLVEAQRADRSIEVFRNMILIPVKVAESTPLSFLLDTGTVGSMVSTRQAESLHLKMEGNEKAYGVGDDTVRMRFARDIPLEILGVAISPETIGVYDFDDLDRQLGRRIDGVIGTSIFKSNVVDLDYSARSVRFFDPRRYSDSGRGTVVNLKIDHDGIPFVIVKIAMPGHEPIDARLCVDTGGSEAISFNRPFVEKHHLLDQLKKQIPSTERGYAGESKSVAGRIESLTLGGYVIHNPIAGFSLAQQGATAESGDDGTIGNALLRRFHIIFNYARDIMIIEQNAAFDDPFEYDMSGLRLVADGDDLKTVRVSGIIPDSPAALAGIRPDDIITDVDGVPSIASDLDRLDAYLKQEGRNISLTVQRGSMPIYLRFTLKRLL